MPRDVRHPEFGQHLKQLRLKMGRAWTQDYAAKRIGLLTTFQLNQLESGRFVKEPEPNVLKAIADAYRRPVEELLRYLADERASRALRLLKQPTAKLAKSGGFGYPVTSSDDPRKDSGNSPSEASHPALTDPLAGTRVGFQKAVSDGRHTYTPPKDQRNYGRSLIRRAAFLEEIRDLGQALARGQVAIVSIGPSASDSGNPRSGGRVPDRPPIRKAGSL